MRIWILIFSAALFAGGTCLGVALQPKLAPQPPVTTVKPPMPEARWSPSHKELSPTRFASDLHLTEEQEGDLNAILSESQEDIYALGRAMKAAQDRSRERIRSILTEEQKKSFDSLLSDERKKRGDAELDRTVSAYRKILKLSDEQASQVRAALSKARSRRHEAPKPKGEGEPVESPPEMFAW